MAINNGNQSPWGGGAGGGRGGGANQGPPDLEALLRQVLDWFSQLLPGGGPRGIIAFAIIAVIALGAWTAYYTVPSDSVAVVQRFGKYLKEVPPGLHFKLPLGIDSAVIVPVKRQLK